jgi:DNA-binding response OmpR family regulator
MHSVFLFSEERKLIQDFTNEANLERLNLSTETDFSSFRRKVHQLDIDIAVVDIGEHPEQLLELCGELKRDYTIDGVRLIVILPHRDENLILAAFRSGADDCVFRPLKHRVLIARIKAVLRRGFPKLEGSQRSKSIRILDLEIQNDEYKVYLAGEPLDLTRSEYNILYTLASHPKRVYSRQQLLTHCGSQRDDTKGRSIDVHVRSLRLKLGKERNLIKTSRGIGYYLEVDSDA